MSLFKYHWLTLSKSECIEIISESRQLHAALILRCYMIEQISDENEI